MLSSELTKLVDVVQWDVSKPVAKSVTVPSGRLRTIRPPASGIVLTPLIVSGVVMGAVVNGVKTGTTFRWASVVTPMVPDCWTGTTIGVVGNGASGVIVTS